MGAVPQCWLLFYSMTAGCSEGGAHERGSLCAGAWVLWLAREVDTG